jgi:histidinol-phosphate aminotransferase
LKEIPLTNEKVHDLPAMLNAINNETSLIYIVNPANPTSTIVKPAVLKDFCVEASKKCAVLIDEAYIDFVDAPNNEACFPSSLRTRRSLSCALFQRSTRWLE